MSNTQRNIGAEFEQIQRDQEDPKWLEWVNPERMESQLTKFFADTVPVMPDDPWSAEGLDCAEREILTRFATMDDVDSPENRDVSDQFTRYIGEVFCRKFEGRWFNVRDMGGVRYPDFGPVVDNPWTDIYLDTANLITATVHRQWGDNISGMFRSNVQTYREWVDAGRPPLVEWIKE